MLAEERPRAPFRVTIDALSTFGGGRPRALLARVVPTPELTKLQADQERLMRRVGLEPESRKYTPHVTLARNAAQAFPPEASPPIRWEAREFVLVWSRLSHPAQYEVLGRYGG